MAKKNEAIHEDSLKREEYSDFTLVLKDGHELQCHKVKLAEVSPFFRTMFRQNCQETKSNKMMMTEFEPDTVKSFVDFIYAQLVEVPDQEVFKKDFDGKRMTLDLLRMSHMYDFNILQDLCVKQLKKSIVDANVVDIWSTAETTGIDSLKEAALDHLGKKQEKMMDVPGMKEAYESSQMMESLVKYTTAQMAQLSPAAANLKKTVTIKGKITVQMRVTNGNQSVGYDVRVKPSDTICTLRQLTNVALSRSGHPWTDFCCEMGTFKLQIHPTLVSSPLDERKTIKHYRIFNGSIITCTVKASSIE